MPATDMIQYVLEQYVVLLSDDRFRDVDFTVVKEHLSCLRGITYDQLMGAVKKHKVRGLGVFISLSETSTQPHLPSLVKGENACTHVHQAKSCEHCAVPVQAGDFE